MAARGGLETHAGHARVRQNRGLGSIDNALVGEKHSIDDIVGDPGEIRRQAAARGHNLVILLFSVQAVAKLSSPGVYLRSYSYSLPVRIRKAILVVLVDEIRLTW